MVFCINALHIIICTG